MSDSMMIDIVNTDDSPLTAAFFATGVAQTIRVKNLEAAAKNCILFMTCNDDKPADLAGLTNYEGKELIDEIWGKARKLGDTPWTPIGEPTYTDDFADISVNVLAFVLGASGHQDFEIMVTIPTGAASTALVNFQIGLKARNV